jgi:D-alanyl-D-alanine carboxypeptidase
MYSTLHELGLWGSSTVGSALLPGTLAAKRLAFRDIGIGAPYGLGIIDFGDGYYGHSGEAFGWEAITMHNPKTGVTIAIATNACAGSTLLFQAIRKGAEEVLARPS